MVEESKGLTKKRIAIALEAFRETVLAFCETMIPGGRRSGHKWICGDLHDGKGKSCAVFLDSGGFNDTNPAADHVKGGPMDLWSAIFGVSDKAEIIAGMEAWVKDGSLPDGRKGEPTAGRIEEYEGETLVARDAQERHLIKTIRYWRESAEGCRSVGKLWIIRYDRGPRERRDSGPIWWSDPCGDPPKVYDGHLYIPTDASEEEWAAIDFSLEKEKQIAWRTAQSRKALSDLYANRWLKAVENTQAIREKFAAELGEFRGLSVAVFLWLLDNGYLAIVYSDKFDTLEVAFPVFRNTSWFPGNPENGIQFLGMHILWFNPAGEKKWKYEPKGCSSEPLIISDPATADLVVIGESTWDVIAFIDLRKLHARGEDRPWAAIATRGAANVKLPEIKQDATVVLLLQNDAANAKWHEKVPKEIRKRARLVIPPDGVKDLNDWIRNVGVAEVNRILSKK
jgi:hypothetical protein